MIGNHYYCNESAALERASYTSGVNPGRQVHLIGPVPIDMCNDRMPSAGMHPWVCPGVPHAIKPAVTGLPEAVGKGLAQDLLFHFPAAAFQPPASHRHPATATQPSRCLAAAAAGAQAKPSSTSSVPCSVILCRCPEPPATRHLQPHRGSAASATRMVCQPPTRRRLPQLPNSPMQSGSWRQVSNTVDPM